MDKKEKRIMGDLTHDKENGKEVAGSKRKIEIGITEFLIIIIFL